MSSFNCESPIEWRLAEILEENPGDVDWQTQKTFAGKLKANRVDFCAQRKGRCVVVECDGREFHDYDTDLKRDCDLLTNTDVTDIVRFRGCDITFLPGDCLKLLKAMFPFLFGDDAEPLGFDDFWVQSRALRGLDILPIYRGLATIEEYGEIKPILNAVDSFSVLGLKHGNVYGIQFKPSGWGWDFHPPKCWQIADYLRFKAIVRDEAALRPWLGFLGMGFHNPFPD